MATRSRGLSAGFGWAKRGIGVGFRHPKPLFGAGALLTLVVMIPNIIMQAIQFYTMHTDAPLQPASFGWFMAFSVLLGLLIVPLYAGYLCVVDEAERGLPARARDIFMPYREGHAPRLIGYGILLAVIYLALFALIIALTGRDVANWYMQVMTARANHIVTPTALPNGFGITFLLFAVVGIFMLGFYSISLGQVTLRDRSVLGAIGDGVIGALKNVLPLLVLTVSLLFIWLGVAICFGIVAFLIIMIGKFAGPWLTLVLLIPLYVALLLTAFTAMFGVMYHLWRDVCDDDIVPGMAEVVVA